MRQFNDSEIWSIVRMKPLYTVAEKDIFKHLVLYNNSSNFKNTTCPFSIVNGTPSVPHYNEKALDWPEVSKLFAKLMAVSAGGEWKPDNCVSQFLVAIIIPIKNRESNLREFLLYIHPFLQRQQIHYRIYVIELPSNITWNKGVLLNVGFIEAMKDKSFPCVILHDVDTLPTHRNHIYACTTGPRFMVVSRGPPYRRRPHAFYGGAVAILSDHFKLINGFSNLYFNWGNEDMDYYNRVRRSGLPIMRFEPEISHFQSLPHRREKAGDSKKKTRIFLEAAFHSNEGLNTTKYNIISRLNEPLCTRIIIIPDL